MNTTLSTKWKTIQLNKIAKLIRGVTYKKAQSEKDERRNYVYILRSNNIQNLKIILDNLVYVPKELIKQEQFLKSGDIVVAMSSGSKHLVGKAGLVPEDMHGAFGTFCGLIRPSENLVNSKYLGYFFDSPQYKKQIRVKSKGVNINNLKRLHIEELEIPLAPIDEQKCIVDKTEKLFSALEASNEVMGQIKQKIPLLKRSIYNKTIIGNTKRVKLKNVATDIRYGYTSKTSKSEEGVKILRITDIQNGNVNWEDVPRCQISDEDERKYLLNVGDIVFARSGNTTGKTFLISDDVPESVYASYLIKIQTDSSKLLPEFLYFYFHSNDYWLQIDKGITGIGQPNFNGTKLSNILLPLPSIEKQIEIVDEIKEIISVAIKNESIISSESEKVFTLKQAILSKAFEGRLI